MTASATKSSSTTRTITENVDRLALIRAKAQERAATKAEREALTAKFSAQAEAEDAEALSQCHVILDRMSERGAVARAQREVPPVRKRGRAIRLAPVTARDAEIEMGTASVRNPYDASTFITATVNRRVDVLSAERGQGRITEAQFQVGRMMQAVWEKQLGVRSGSAWDSTTSNVGPGTRVVTQGLSIEDIRMLGRIETPGVVKVHNDRAARVIGDAGVRFLRAILAEGHSFGSYAEARGRGTSPRAGADIAQRFRWVLAELTEAQHTARAPGAAPIRDAYAAQADAVEERLERSAALAAEHAEAEEELEKEKYAEWERTTIAAAS